MKIDKIMKKDTLVSILIPLYNAEKYIAETIESCINQTYNNVEIIIVDDGSTDKSLNIAKKYSESHQNITILCQTNAGAPRARNLAFAQANGEYIQYLDADDILHPDKIRLQVKELIKYDDSKTLVFGPYLAFHKSIKNSNVKKRITYKNYYEPKEFLLDWWKTNEANMPHTWLVSRRLIEASGNWDEELQANQDGDFFSRIIFNSTKLIYIEDSISYYRLDNINSISKRRSHGSQESRLKTYDHYVQLMGNENYDQRINRILAINYSNFYFQVLLDYDDLATIAKERIKSLGIKEPIKPKREKYFMYAIGIKNTLKLKYFFKKLKQIWKSI